MDNETTLPQAHEGRIFTIALHPTQLQLASGGNDQHIWLWDVQTRQCLKTISGHTAAVAAIRFTPNGQQLISASFDQTIRVWDLQTGGCLKALITPRPYEGMNVAGVVGLTEAEITTLKTLSAIDAAEPSSC